MGIEVIYLHKREFCYKTNKGLSERIVRQDFKKRGFEVWKGSYLQFQEEFFVHQRDKYELLVNELKYRIGHKRYWRLILWGKAFAGIPDFVVMRNEDFYFVEVKFNNESIKKNQLNTILFLQELNLKTIIVRVSDNKTIFSKELDLITGKSYLKSYIPKLNRKIWRK